MPEPATMTVTVTAMKKVLWPQRLSWKDSENIKAHQAGTKKVKHSKAWRPRFENPMMPAVGRYWH